MFTCQNNWRYSSRKLVAYSGGIKNRKSIINPVFFSGFWCYGNEKIMMIISKRGPENQNYNVKVTDIKWDRIFETEA